MKRNYKTYTLQPIMKNDFTKKEERLDQPNLILFIVIVICAVLFWV